MCSLTKFVRRPTGTPTRLTTVFRAPWWMLSPSSPSGNTAPWTPTVSPPRGRYVRGVTAGSGGGGGAASYRPGGDTPGFDTPVDGTVIRWKRGWVVRIGTYLHRSELRFKNRRQILAIRCTARRCSFVATRSVRKVASQSKFTEKIAPEAEQNFAYECPKPFSFCK